LSPIGAQGASEKCAKACTDVHIPCTVFPQAQRLCNYAREREFRGFFQHIFARAKKVSKIAQGLPEENFVFN
jgi:hypothetical protein